MTAKKVEVKLIEQYGNTVADWLGGRAILGHYSIIDDDGHYNYLDIDQVSSTSPEAGPPGSGYEAGAGPSGSGNETGTRSPGYETLDPAGVSTFRQPQRRHHYAGLPSSTHAVEHIEMTNVDNGDEDYVDPVSSYFSFF